MNFQTIISSYERIPKDASAQLDSLRGFSALIVLFTHANQLLIGPSYQGFLGIGGLLAQFAVMVFFVLSGFLIGKSLTRNVHQNKELHLSSYLFDRFNRIYPPLLFSIFLVIILLWISPWFFASGINLYISNNPYLAREGFIATASSIISSALFLNGFIGETISANGPLWSLSYEVWYYVLAAFLFKSKNIIYAFLAIALVLILGILNHSFIIHAVVWFLGLALCLLHNNGYSGTLLKLAGYLSFISTILFSSIYLLDFHEVLSFPTILAGQSMLLAKLSVGLLTTSIIYYVLNGGIKISAFFKDSSAYSYTLYIIHVPILLFILGVTEPNIIDNTFNALIAYIFSCILILIVSKLSAAKVEKMQVLKYKNKALN